MRIKDSKGISFIELCIIIGMVSIVSIIVAIAVHQLTGYAHKTSVRSTLYSMAAAQEAHMTAFGSYSACTSVRECELALNPIHFKPAGNVEITVVVKNDGRDFAIMAIHGDKIAVGCWDSRNGGLQEDCSTAGF